MFTVTAGLSGQRYEIQQAKNVLARPRDVHT